MQEIFISGTKVSSKDSTIDLTKSMNVLQEPDKRTSEYTKTVSIVGTKEADRVFMAQFDVNFNAGNVGFDPTRKAPLVVYENSIEIMTGYAQLTDVVIVDEVNHEYKCIFYGVLRDLFYSIGDSELCDIDWSDLDHTYNKTNITASWSATKGVGYVYPMVNYGWTNPNILKVQDWRAWVYFKEIWDRIFADAGFEYQSNFINSNRFKSLIYYGDEPFELSQADVGSSVVQVDRITSEQVVAFPFGLVNFNNTILDPSSQYNGNTRITASSTGVRVIDVYMLANIVNVGATLSGNNYQASMEYRVEIYNSVSVLKKAFSATVTSGIVTLIPKSTGVLASSNLSVEYDFDIGDFLVVSIPTGNISLVRRNGSRRIERFFANADLQLKIQPTSQLNFRLATNQLVEGNTYRVGAVSVGCMKQKDWLMGVIKMFNLYIEPQPNGILLIEPREDFYTDEVDDLTELLAVDQEFTIMPLELAKYKRYKYMYAQGKDLFAQSYADSYEEPYGTVEIEIDNDFAKDIKEIKLPFSLPCMANNAVTGSANSARVVPVLLNLSDNNPYRGSSIGKVLVYGAAQLTLSLWRFAGEIFARTGYPYAGQLDDLNNPTFDLAFDIPQEIYWQREGRNDVALIENGGVYSQYHETEIEELTNKNSKIVECYVALNESRFNQLSFRKAIFIRNAYYRLHEVNYLGSDHLSKLTLLKLNVFTKKTAVVVDTYKDSNVGDVSVGVVKGRDNTIDQSSDGVVVLGRDNFVSGELSGVLIGGNGNTVNNSNVTILNLANQVSPLPNTFSLGFNHVEYDDDNEYLGIEGSPFVVVMNSANVKTFTLPGTGEHEGKMVIVKHIGGGSTQVKEGASDLAVVLNNTTKWFFNNGTNWIEL